MRLSFIVCLRSLLLFFSSFVLPHSSFSAQPSVLFNLREDHYETHNIAQDCPKKTTHLTNAWLRCMGAKLATPNPDFDEKRWWISAGTK